ncbi:SIR2 family NAD-dependent protein deacylase [Rhodococcus tibetensis]|uniref:SIR2 family protein n=1 Tax=Rhodococcus tibetensis TaxID=2965064 RepID=A0ABT1Q9I2_9NOCA|nr:SIR2 family protein [Rhodococcus sp. FXJ9.536]MCQ4118380.1 SIR2 family protein [Rhodococcus sp. FXJ9.536]
MVVLIDRVPRHLLDELVEGSWLPIIGAGFSRNAVFRDGDPPASWAELGAALGSDIEGVDDSIGTLEAISAFEQAYGRVALIDRTSSLIRAHDAGPGPAHVAFARIGFSNVVTTNFDLLLERAYERIDKGCLPVVDETQLSTPNRYAGPRLIKFHGDINHPARMVITEDDYDRFLQVFPLLVTSVTAMLVERTGVLVGYSLDDPDTRQILALIKTRLGNMKRPLWSVQIDATPQVVNRYERRGVKVINSPGIRGRGAGEILEQFFDELAQYWRDRLPEKSVSLDDRVTADFRTPQEASRICYFAIPATLIGWYRDLLFPEVEAHGLVPVTARDVFSPPGTVSAKLDTLISRAAYVVAEVGDQSSEYEAALAIAKKPEGNVLLVAPEGHSWISPNLNRQKVLTRPVRFESNSETFVQNFREWLSSIAHRTVLKIGEPERLLVHREYGAALISAVSLLEVVLSEKFAEDPQDSPRHATLRSMLKQAERQELFASATEHAIIMESVNQRNRTIHTQSNISPVDSRRFVKAIRQFVDRLTSKEAY